MDDITYAAFEIANEIGTTNERDLINRVKDKFTLFEFDSIEKTIHALFSLSSAYFEPYFIGIVILDKSRDEMRLTTHAKKLFLEEKAKREKQVEKDEVDFKLKKISISSLKFQRLFSIFSILVAILAVALTFYFHRIDSNKSKSIELQQLPQILKSQQDNRVRLKQYLDSLTKLLHDETPRTLGSR